jgi:hypothetical protein
VKAKTFYITSLSSIQEATKFIIGLIPDGKFKVVISNAGDKSSKQRGLQWIWNNDVSKSGIGGEHEETPGGVHIVSKFRFALPILIRDDDFFADLWQGWYEKHQYDKEALMYFVEHHVSTEVFSVSQMAEYLTNFKNHYIKHGVNLTAPEFRGLLNG